MIISATIVLGLLVFIHEGGHFLTARAFGVRVSEFMIGLPGPNIGFTWRGTRFGVTAVPLGGYAAICGMLPPEDLEQTKRMLTYVYAHGTVVMEDAARDLGIEDDEAYNLLEELSEWGSIARPGRKDKINIYRTLDEKGLPDGSPRSIDDMDALFESETKQQYWYQPFWKRSLILVAGPAVNIIYTILVFLVIYSVIGVDITNSAGELQHIVLSPLDALTAGFRYIGMVLVAIIGLFNPATAADTVSNSTSIIGIAVLSKDALMAGAVDFLFFSAVVSVSLGLMNLLPIPPLDGGRFVVELVQKISSRQVPVRVQNIVSTVGMVLFLGFFLVMVNQDVQRFIFGNWS